MSYLSRLFLQSEQTVNRALGIGLPVMSISHSSAAIWSESNLGDLLGLGNQLVSILGEVLLRLQYSVSHDDGCCD